MCQAFIVCLLWAKHSARHWTFSALKELLALMLITFRPFPGGGPPLHLDWEFSGNCSLFVILAPVIYKELYFCKVLLHPLSHFIGTAPIQGKAGRRYYSIWKMGTLRPRKMKWTVQGHLDDMTWLPARSLTEFRSFDSQGEWPIHKTLPHTMQTRVIKS